MTELKKTNFGTLPSGQEISLFTFSGSAGFEIAITNYGGRIVSIKAPNRNGDVEDVALGFDNLDGYAAKNPYFGALVGRFANRIGNAQFQLDGTTYHLSANTGPNTLHGGFKGFDKAVWAPAEVRRNGGPALQLTHIDPDGEDGFPGELSARVTYSLANNNELHIEFEASTTKPTVLNLTNHSYFDLSGQGKGNIADHIVTINADHFTPTDENLIPTGELRPVANSPFDFRTPHRVGDRIDDKNEQLKLALGYDHNFVLNGATGELQLAARAVHPPSGRVLEVLTTQPGVQFYTGNHLDGTVQGKGGVVYGYRMGFCLETQHFPDSPNHPEFPSTKLSPGETYSQTTVFRFSVER